MREKRDEILILRITKTEKNRIYEKMYGMGIRSLSAYIRKMALDGYCLNLTIDKSRIQRFLGQTTRNEMRRIEEALMNSLEINEWDRRNADE